MKAVLFANAQIEDYECCYHDLKNADIVLCCDGGMRHAKKLGIMPQYGIGDFDSVSADILNYYKKKGMKIKKFPARKDETDLELGLDFAVELGADEIIVFGAIGSRFDHTMCNAQLLFRMLKKGVKTKLINENNEVELIQDKTTVYGKKGDIVSTVPLSMEVKGIYLKGLEYPLINATLTIGGDMIAVSNIMTGEQAEISIEEGYLFVIKAKDS